MTESKGPAEHAVDLVVFAPIGLALEARNLLPTLVERGRQQVMMTKMVGRFAVAQGQTVGRKRLSKAQAQAGAIMAELGLATSDHHRKPSAGLNGVRSAGTESNGSADSATADAKGAGAAPSRRVTQSSAASAELAISDYDSLAASHVIPRLAGLDADELEAVRAYESAHRARKTILGKIAQLQGS